MCATGQLAHVRCSKGCDFDITTLLSSGSLVQVAAKQRQRSSVDKALGYWRMMAASSAFRQWRETVWVRSLPCISLLTSPEAVWSTQKEACMLWHMGSRASWQIASHIGRPSGVAKRLSADQQWRCRSCTSVTLLITVPA